MTTLAIARLEDVRMGPEIVTYLKKIDATLPPFGGRFQVHGGSYERVEGEWTGDLVVVSFPDRAAALAWYASAAYQEILPLRTRNARCDVILVDTVEEDYRAADFVTPRG